MKSQEAQFKSFLKSALSKKSEAELDEAEMSYLRYLRLLVDIEYRLQKNGSLDGDGSRGYIVNRK